MTKLVQNCKPTGLRPGDRLIYRKADASLTIKRGSDNLRFRHTGNEKDLGEIKLLLGKVDDIHQFLTGLQSFVSALTGLDTRSIETGNAYIVFELVKPKATKATKGSVQPCSSTKEGSRISK